jgi:hypothetical protein
MTKKKTAANKIVIPYTPRPLQKEFHLNARRWNVAVCHRRFGKTVMAASLTYLSMGLNGNITCYISNCLLRIMVTN